MTGNSKRETNKVASQVRSKIIYTIIFITIWTIAAILLSKSQMDKPNGFISYGFMIPVFIASAYMTNLYIEETSKFGKYISIILVALFMTIITTGIFVYFTF